MNDTTVLLLDLSGSMEHLVGTSGQTRRDMLAQAVANVVPRHPGIQVYAFNYTVERIYEPLNGLPPAIGGTDLTAALQHIRTVQPDTLILVSDGEPDDAKSALTAAVMLNARISAIYCGDESNRRAMSFLRDLALCSSKGTIGRAKVASLAKPEDVAQEILMLSAPSR